MSIEELSQQENIAKFQTAADIVSRCLNKVVDACKSGSLVVDLCQLGDQCMLEGVKGVYNKAKNGVKPTKGIAFPTSINVNNYVCHFSPLKSDPEASLALKEGDMVKIEMGVHVDGFPAMVGHTLVVGATKEKPVTGKAADVIQSAYLAAEAALRLLKPGNKNFDITDAVQKIVKDEFDCLPVEGMLSSELVRHSLDGGKQIIFNPSEPARREFATHEFGKGEIWSIDIIVSGTDKSHARQSQNRTTIYKRTETSYNLKMQASRNFLSEVSTKFGEMPFNLRNMADETKARIGLVECSKHDLIMPYTVIEEKEGVLVAQFLFTVLILPNGNVVKITKPPFDQDLIKSEKSVKDEELKKLLDTEFPVKQKADKK